MAHQPLRETNSTLYPVFVQWYNDGERKLDERPSFEAIAARIATEVLHEVPTRIVGEGVAIIRSALQVLLEAYSPVSLQGKALKFEYFPQKPEDEKISWNVADPESEDGRSTPLQVIEAFRNHFRSKVA